MMTKALFGGLATVAALGTAALAITTNTAANEVERIDFGTTVTATAPAFDARVMPASDARIREFRIPMTHRTIEIAGVPGR